MNKSKKIFKQIQTGRLIALLTPGSPEECVQAFETCRDQGITLEIAFRSKAAPEGIRAVLAAHPEALILAGTVMTAEQASEAIAAGAAGIVSADYIPEVVEVCVQADIMCVPGGLSDAGKQLVLKSRLYGCTLEELRTTYPYQWVYKLFPAFEDGDSRMGLAKAWKGPIKGLQIIYTGGINRNTLKSAVKMDPDGIFSGSALTKNRNDPEKMSAEIRAWKAEFSAEGRPKRPPRKEAEEAGVVVTFGEIMARLSSPPGVRLRQASSFDVNFGGAEANVAAGLAGFGVPSRFVTALPDNDLGDAALRRLRAAGVDTSRIVRKKGRLGLYFLEHGAGPRPSRVIYDRAGSAVSQLTPRDIDWEEVFHRAVWFHWSGITPALGENVCSLLLQGLSKAAEMGIPVSADLNFRKKLWTEERAREVMTELMPYVDVLIGNEEDPLRVFGLKPGGKDMESGSIDPAGYESLTQGLMDRFGFKKVAITLRESLSASENYWSACLRSGDSFLVGPRHHVWIVDRVGSGDAFAAGLIYGLLKGKSDAGALAFGIASACLKHTVQGDFNDVSPEEAERLASGEASGRVRR
jgi:2-dehydro-3-deoxygluconokinase